MRRRLTGWSSVVCPVCSAPPRRRCVDLTGGSTRIRQNQPHPERVTLAAGKPKQRRKRRPAAPIVVRKIGSDEIVAVRSQRSIRTGRTPKPKPPEPKPPELDIPSWRLEE